MGEVILEAKKLTKIYNESMLNEVVAINNVDLIIHKGDFAAIVGTSGSGKSTLIHLLGGLDKPTSGDVYIGPDSMYTFNDKQMTEVRRNRISFVFQKFCLIQELTLYENIVLPLLFSKKKIDKEYVYNVCDELGIKDRLTHKAFELSGGQQQRCAIARAIVSGTEVILCDEPTGNLDKNTGREVVELLHKINKKYNITVVVVTHDMETASGADYTIAIEDGKII